MLAIVSPAKNLDMSRQLSQAMTAPQFSEDAAQLVEQLAATSPQEIASLMGLSDKLAHLNFERYANYSPDAGTHALAAFNGDVYAGLDAANLPDEALAYLSRHLRILSGLYGLLRPTDKMHAYRLEMGTRLETPRGATLYDWWGNKIKDALVEALSEQTPVLVNLASQEYAKAARLKDLPAQVITPQFKDLKNGQYKIISFYAKKARGLMARYMALHQITDLEALKGFNLGGYRFNESLSSGSDWVFTRDEPA